MISFQAISSSIYLFSSFLFVCICGEISFTVSFPPDMTLSYVIDLLCLYLTDIYPFSYFLIRNTIPFFHKRTVFDFFVAVKLENLKVLHSINNFLKVDVENIWRQHLSSPTLHLSIRVDFLQLGIVPLICTWHNDF